jgi:hypothetical protein
MATSTEASRAVKLCGTEAVDPPTRRLAAGPLSVELENGQLRYVTFAGTEVLRAIAFLVRDENWGTFTPAIDGLKIEESGERFSVAYRAVCADAKRRLVYHGRISGKADGSLDFEVVAEPETDVATNRTGFIVLHPAGLAGQAVKVTHVNGREEAARFPMHISPAQPIFDIRALSHEISPGVFASCRMEGDAFEMEDQRNWGDASYKTYVRPLALPWGYTLAKGSRHEQAVRLSIAGRAAPGAGPKEAAGVAVALGDAQTGKMPELGIGLPAEEGVHALAASDLVRELAPQFLVCGYDTRDRRGLSALDSYRRLAEAARAALAFEVIVADDQDPAAVLAAAGAAMARVGVIPAAVVVSPAADLKSWQPGAKRPERPTAEEIARAARAAFPAAKLGAGMLSYFTELNRRRPNTTLFDFVTHTTTGIVHAADDRSVMETLETLPAIIDSTRSFIGSTPYRIGPSAIACRDNPYGRGVAANPGNGRVCLTDRDPRQRGLFAAAWTLGYVAASAYCGLEAVAMGAPTGPFGFIHRPADQQQPYFGGLDGPAVYPAFHVMAGLARGSGQPLIAAKVSQPNTVAALAWRDGDRRVLWLANLTAQPVEIVIAGLPKTGAGLSVIDATTFERATREPGALDNLARPLSGAKLTLDAYGVARID